MPSKNTKGELKAGEVFSTGTTTRVDVLQLCFNAVKQGQASRLTKTNGSQKYLQPRQQGRGKSLFQHSPCALILFLFVGFFKRERNEEIACRRQIGDRHYCSVARISWNA